MVRIATRSTPADEWTYLAGSLSSDRTSVTVQVEHFSFFAAVAVDVDGVVDEFKKQFVESLSGGLIQNIQKPICDNAEGAESKGYSALSTQTDVVLWCIGLEEDRPVLKMTSHRRYPMYVDHPGLDVIDKGSLWEQWGDLAVLARADSGPDSVLLSGDSLVYGIDIPEGERAIARTRLSSQGNAWAALQAGIDALIAIFTLGEGKAVMESVPTAVQLTKLALESHKCVAAFNQAAGDVLTDCVLPLATELNFGKSVGVLVGPLVSAESLLAWLQGQVNAVTDEATQRDEYEILITRGPPLSTQTTPTLGRFPAAAYTIDETMEDGTKLSLDLKLSSGLRANSEDVNRLWLEAGGVGDPVCIDSSSGTLGGWSMRKLDRTMVWVGTATVRNRTVGFDPPSHAWTVSSVGYGPLSALGFGFSSGAECQLSERSFRPRWKPGATTWGPVPILIAYEVFTPDNPEGQMSGVSDHPLLIQVVEARDMWGEGFPSIRRSDGVEVPSLALPLR